MYSYNERVDQLLNDGYLVCDRAPQAFTLTAKGSAKLNDLIHDGFLVMVPREDSMRLTDKGVSVLLACADRPIPKQHRIPIGKRK